MRVSCGLWEELHCQAVAYFTADCPYFVLSVALIYLAWSLGLSWESSSAALVSQAAEHLRLTHVNCPAVSFPRARVLWLLNLTS